MLSQGGSSRGGTGVQTQRPGVREDRPSTADWQVQSRDENNLSIGLGAGGPHAPAVTEALIRRQPTVGQHRGGGRRNPAHPPPGAPSVELPDLQSTRRGSACRQTTWMGSCRVGGRTRRICSLRCFLRHCMHSPSRRPSRSDTLTGPLRASTRSANRSILSSRLFNTCHSRLLGLPIERDLSDHATNHLAWP